MRIKYNSGRGYFLKKTTPMLKEIQTARQIEGEPKRRWFSNRFFDLIVWFKKNDNEITGFQLCYNISF
ncbi:hypothetical protein IH970_14450 [candidate division KSB1 bacterium]|nr:hypothetical protein [candidate division KSB1 bacterium]